MFEAQESGTPTTGDTNSLPGINGNPWPDDADDNHLDYPGGGGLGIWNQFGGGVKNGGVSSQTAKDMYSAVASFSGSGYSWIREAQAAGDTTSNYGKKGKLCEDFITAGVKSGNGWNGGPTYRGIDGISNAAFNAYANLKPGDSVDPNFGGTASWSTNKDVSFSGFSGGNNSVVFVHTGSSQPKGVSIDAISSNGGEMEVLVSKDSKYKVQHVAKYKGQGWSGVGVSSTEYLLVYVEDA